MVTYSVRGKVTHLLAWGAVNARHRPGSSKIRQIHFKLDYSGGWKHRKLVWKTFKNACEPYDGPELAWFVAGCKASNGSYWALQSWQTALPDLGLAPWLGQQKTWWLHLSHWTGRSRRARRLHRLGLRRPLPGGLRPVHLPGRRRPRLRDDARRATRPTSYGRLLYLDTYNSSYGPGWLRENSFVSHGPPGMFCYGFFPRNPYVGGYAHPRGTPNRKRGPGTGEHVPDHGRGPGVTPDVMWQGSGLHSFNRNNPADVIAREPDEQHAGLDPRQLAEVPQALAAG